MPTDVIALLPGGEALAAAVDRGLVGLVVADDRRVTEANDEYLRIVGGTRPDLEAHGIPWLRITAPESIAADGRAISELRSRGTTAGYEKEYLRLGGGRVRVLLRPVLIDDDPLRMGAGVIECARIEGAAGDERALLDEVVAALRGDRV